MPEQWPRVGARYEQAGLVHDGHTEIVYMASVGARLAEAAISGLLVRRSVGSNGTRLAAMPGDEMIGDIEVLSHDDAGRLLRSGGWADIGNLHVAEGYRRRGVATWLMGQAAAWLRLARVERVLDYAWLEHQDEQAFLVAMAFHELTRTARGWRRAR